MAELKHNADAGLRKVQELLKLRGPDASLASNRGLAAEVAHATSFNADAVNKGSGIRAEVVPGGKAHDLRIFDQANPLMDLDRAQLKLSNNADYLAKLNDPKYDGMQKVVAKGMEHATRGRASTVKHGDVSSSPLSVEQADRLAQNPQQYMDTLRPYVVLEAVGAGVQGAVVGATLGLVNVLGAAIWSKGTVSKEDGKRAAKVAGVGATAGAAAGVVGTLAGSSGAGGLAGGAVATAFSVAASKDPDERFRRAVTGAAGVAAGVGAAALSGAALPLVSLTAWPIGMAAAIAAYMYADRSARALVEPHCNAVGDAARSGWAAAAVAARQGREGAGTVAARVAEGGVPVARAAWGGVSALAGGVYGRARGVFRRKD